MKQPVITVKDLECLEHLRNVGQFVGELMQVEAKVLGERQERIHAATVAEPQDVTAQLNGVVERCNHRWFTGEGNV